MPEENERLARIETNIEHIVKVVDKAEKDRAEVAKNTATMNSDFASQFASLHQRVAHIERQMPQLDANTQTNSRQDGYSEGQRHDEATQKSHNAFLISVAAILLGLVGLVLRFWGV